MKPVQSILQLSWVAFCALSMMAQTRLLLDLPLQPGLLDGFVFGGTIFGYYCTYPVRFYRILAWIAGFFGGFCFLASLYAVPYSLDVHLTSLVPVLFWLAYYGFQKPGNRGLRTRPLAKPLTISLTWAWVTVLLPVPPSKWADLFFVLSGRAAFIFALALAYDLIDTEYDQKRGLKTLVGQLGHKRSMTLMYRALAFAALLVSLNVYFGIYGWQIAAGMWSSLLFSAWWLTFLRQKKAWERAQKPLIDGLMILQFLLVWFFARFA